MYVSVQLCVLICYWVPDHPDHSHHLQGKARGLLVGAEDTAGPGDRHHLAQGQGHQCGTEADAGAGHPWGSELDLQCQGVERNRPV